MSKILPSLKTNTAGVRYDNETGFVCAGNAKLSHFSTLEKKKRITIDVLHFTELLLIKCFIV